MPKEKTNKKKKRGSSWGEVPSNNFKDAYYKKYDKFKFPEMEFATIRLIGDAYPVKIHWVPTIDKNKKEISFPILCKKNNSEDNKCLCCEAALKTQTVYLSNSIIRDIQENSKKGNKKPNKNQKFRVPGDKWWSPVKVIQLPHGAASKIKNLKSLNKVKDKKTGKIIKYDMNDIKNGMDINICFDKNQSGSGMYDIQKEERTPLSKEEKAYLLYDLGEVYECVPPDSEMLESLKRAYDNDCLDDENCDLKAVKKIIKGESKNKKKGKNKKKVDNDNSDNDNDNDNNDNDDLDEDNNDNDNDNNDNDDLDEDNNDNDNDNNDNDNDNNDNDDLDEDNNDNDNDNDNNDNDDLDEDNNDDDDNDNNDNDDDEPKSKNNKKSLKKVDKKKKPDSKKKNVNKKEKKSKKGKKKVKK